MKRRDFLKTIIVSAGALAVGCGDDADNQASADMSTGGTTGGATGGSMGGAPAGGSMADMDMVSDGGMMSQPGSAFFPQSLASGDPTANSVILWTRVEDPDRAADDIAITLEVATDEAFANLVMLGGNASLEVNAEASFDHCIKIRVTDLQPATVYYYRFTYTRAEGTETTRVGRTKMAPADDADAAVRFAYVSCQDITGKFYNTYARMLNEDLDFVVHLGDYVYETTGDSSFQQTGGRGVTFRDTSEAIVFNEGMDSEFFAARSIGNYRDLYRFYRQDSIMQAIHERWPMICIWDDHEFSDDSHGAHGTYFDGRSDELDVQRRKNANQAWFEYMPVDYAGAPDFRYDPSIDFPNDIRIYRNIRYGRNLELVMTDLRTYRSDHLIPEDVLPGRIAIDQATLMGAVVMIPDFASPYVDVDTYDSGALVEPLRTAVMSQGASADKINGLLSVSFINSLLPNTISEMDAATLERGVPFSSLGKSGVFGNVGSRYLVVEDLFRLYAGIQYAATTGASEDAFGADQEEWFLNTMQNSSATWKVWGNEFCLTPLTVDISGLADMFGDLAQKFSLSAEDWSGMPNRRDAIITALANVDNVIAITGDIHAFFAGTPTVTGDPTQKIIELVTAGISSTPYRTLLAQTAASDPVLAAAGADSLALVVEGFLLSKSDATNPHLGFAKTNDNGFAIVELSANTFDTTFYAIPGGRGTEDLTQDATLNDAFTIYRFRVNAGERELYQNIEGEWRRWDMNTLEWIAG